MSGQVWGVRADDVSLLHASADAPERFAELFDRHHRRIWRYLARLGGPECADDLASEVFVTAFRRRSSFDPERGSVTSWLYGIATNLARTRARSRARGRRAIERLQTQPMTGVGFEEDVAARDALVRAVDALHLLSVDHREVLVLYVWEELDYAAIAQVLDVEIGTVRSRLSRARGHLRELLAGRGQDVDVVPINRRSVDG